MEFFHGPGKLDVFEAVEFLLALSLLDLMLNAQGLEPEVRVAVKDLLTERLVFFHVQTGFAVLLVLFVGFGEGAVGFAKFSPSVAVLGAR